MTPTPTCSRPPSEARPAPRIRRGHPPRLPGLRQLTLALFACGAASFCHALPTAAAGELPTGMTLRAGSATLNTTGSTMTLTQTSAKAVYEAGSFSIGSAAAVNVTAPSARSLTLVRVLGSSTPSVIDGQLTSNARMFLVNTGGILFGATARVNVGALVASTRDLDPALVADDYAGFMDAATTDYGLGAGTDLNNFSAYGGYGGDAVWVEAGAQLTAAADGGVVLVAGRDVRHAGSLSADNGLVALAAAPAGTVSLPVGDSGFIQLTVRQADDPLARDTDVDRTVRVFSSGTLTATDGRVRLLAVGNAGADERDRPSVALAGRISARSTGAGTSSVELVSSIASSGLNGTVQITGPVSGSTPTIDVSGDGSSAQGGSVVIGGQAIGIGAVSGTQAPIITADGAAGGGAIRIGEVAGRSDLDSPRVISIGSGTVLSADATASGNGGTVSVVSTYDTGGAVAGQDFGVTAVYGTLRARGGTAGGNGGRIETSGPALATAFATTDASGNILSTVQATVDAGARASGGSAGTWTIDPYDVSISAAAPSGVSGFTPTAPGANIDAATISSALSAGTSVTVATGSGGTQAGNITLEQGTALTSSSTTPTTLTLAAANDVILERATFITSTGAPLNVNLLADTDNSGSGSVALQGFDGTPLAGFQPVQITTNGGNVLISGGSADPVTAALAGGARGNAAAAVSLSVATLNAGSGTVTIRGLGDGSSDPAVGVGMSQTAIVGSEIRIVGLTTTEGFGVGLTDSQLVSPNITVIGTTDQGTGVRLADTTLGVSAAGGQVTVAGRGSAYGINYNGLTLASPNGAATRATLAGQATGTGGIGIGVDVSGNPLAVHGASTSTASAMDLTLIASADDTATGRSLALGGTNNFNTTGRVGVAPGTVSAAGVIGQLAGQAIRIGSATGGAATSFLVNMSWFAGATTTPTDLVIGSAQHTGGIYVGSTGLGDASGNAFGSNLTLQNQGAGSQGIAFEGTAVASGSIPQLALLTAGDVTQAGGIAADQLVVSGTAASEVLLNAATNRIAAISFDPPADLQLVTAGPLSINGATATGYDAGSGLFTTLAITTNQGGQTALLRSIDSTVTLNAPVAMTGANSLLDIVAATFFRNPGSHTLTNGAGGRWRVWSDNWDAGEGTGFLAGGLAGSSPTPSLYGCQYGDTGTCSTSGVALPTSGNQFHFVDQPTLTVQANDASRAVGAPNPAFGYTASGLVNGDTAAQALAGDLASAADAGSPAGSYAIEQGSLLSPQGYLLAFDPGVLTVTARTTTPDLPPEVRRPATLQTEVYGRNSPARPQLCTAASTLADTGQEEATDPLAVEWTRVRGQPNVSGCVTLGAAGTCSAF